MLNQAGRSYTPGSNKQAPVYFPTDTPFDDILYKDTYIIYFIPFFTFVGSLGCDW